MHWYFGRKGKSYTGGTFKGLSVAAGVEGVERFGILLRALMPISVSTEADGSLKATDLCETRKGGYVEGPCLVVHKILELTRPASLPKVKGFEIKDLVA